MLVTSSCGNSPKNLFIQNLSIALAKGDIQTALSCVSDDIRWVKIGRNEVQGKDAFSVEIKQTGNVTELSILHAFTHGRAGVVNGVKTMSDGEKRAFCEIFDFCSLKGYRIREITTYEISIA